MALIVLKKALIDLLYFVEFFFFFFYMHVGPVCLRKLSYNLNFNIFERYQALLKFSSN